jgi:hypothetical protein
MQELVILIDKLPFMTGRALQFMLLSIVGRLLK